MRLQKAQKEGVLRWIAEGLKSDEMNERALGFIPPFQVSRRQVTYYRNTRRADIEALVKAGEQDALSEGLARRGERVTKLKMLAALLEKDLFGGFLWLQQEKGIGSGAVAKIVDYEEFNRTEVEAYRGVLDDIARELGHRRQEMNLSGVILTEDVSDLDDDELDARLDRLFDAARERGVAPSRDGETAAGSADGH